MVILLEQNPCLGQQVSHPVNPLLRVLCPIHHAQGTGHSMELLGLSFSLIPLNSHEGQMPLSAGKKQHFSRWLW